MSNKAILRHSLILQRLRQSPATLPEILDYIEQRTEAEHDTQKRGDRTFHRDKAAILRIYGTDIKYRAVDKCYYLDEQSNPQLGDRILEAFNIGNMLQLPEAVSGQILFEKRRPQGIEHTNKLLYAIREHLMLHYAYQSFTDDAITERTVYPYALKEFKGRWYLLASESKEGEIKSFGLDRMTDIEITKRSFKVPKGFNPEQKYRDCFGIMGPNSNAPATIVLSFDPVAGRYIKSFPLHHSQELLVDTEEEVQISLRLYETRDLVMEILSYGASVRVMQPASLRAQLREEHLRALDGMEG